MTCTPTGATSALSSLRKAVQELVMAAPLSQAHRAMVLRRLREIELQLGDISTWLTMVDEDKAAIVLEQAWQSVAAAGWVLTRQVRTRPEGWLGQGN
jgi:hypothetical protein